jgi:hypothetical protein
MMSNHHDPIALDALLKQNMVWKLLEVAATHAGRVEVMSLGMNFNLIDCVLKLSPKLLV